MNKESAISHGWAVAFLRSVREYRVFRAAASDGQAIVFHPDEKHASDGQAVADHKQTLLAMLLTRLPVSDSVDLL